MSIRRGIVVAAVAVFNILAMAQKPEAAPTTPETPLENVFQAGLMVQDTNGDSIADAICGHVVVAKSPGAVENTAAANMAARLGYETSALTLPIVIATGQTAKGCGSEKASIWIGRDALAAAVPVADAEKQELQIGEGAVFAAPGGILVVGADPAGVIAAADGYSAHAPFQWSTGGEKLQGIARTVNARLASQKLNATVELVGVTYQSGQPGIRRAILKMSQGVDSAAVLKALSAGEGEAPLRGISAREIKLLMPGSAPIVVAGSTPARAAAVAPAAADAAGSGGDAAAGPRLLDLRELYGIHGLLTGNQKKLVPESVAAKLYVPAGDAGIAMANLAARMGLETTGITLPIALPEIGASPVQVNSPVVIAGDNSLTMRAKDNLGAPGGTALDKLVPGQFAKDGSLQLPSLKAGEGELDVVDRVFGNNPALMVRGDAAGSTAALDYAAGRLPYLWEPSKKFAGLDEMRLDLAKFFSLRNSTGQASTALFLLDGWADAIHASGKKVTSAQAEVDVDESDPKLATFVHDELVKKLNTTHIEVKTGNLHAGTKCCSSDPDVHNVSMIVPYKPAEPTFRDDFTIPWEGKRMLDAVKKAAASMPKGQLVHLEVRVSEGPEERVKLKQQLMDLLTQAGATSPDVTVLCT
ncbi:MAG TPA: hypothetical protein VIM67_05890, partial [Terriglobus sp.]